MVVFLPMRLKLPKKTHNGNGLISFTKAAKILGVTRQTVYSAVQRGVLKRIEIDGKPFIQSTSLDNYRRNEQA